MESGLDELNATLEALGGCGDGDCKVYVRPGMHTNGGCRCLRDDKYKAERVISAYRRYVRFAEATRAPSDAALVKALEKAEATLALCEHLRSEDRDYGPEVDELGRRIGFGALMSSAQASWRKYLHDKGNPLGSEFVAGPCFGTVTRTLGIIRAALAAAKGQQP